MLSEIVVSTTTALGIGGVFTSPRFDADAYDEIAISCYSNVAGSLAVQQSNDGTNYDVVKTITYTAAAVVAIAAPITAKYGRLVYTNGGVAQTSFRLYGAKKKGVDHTTALADLQADIDIIKAATDLLDTADSGTTHDITTANDKAETDVFEITKSTRYAFSAYFDLSVLVAAAEGGTVTLILYNKIDETNYREIARSAFIVGADTTHPSFEARMLNHNTKVTIQCSNDVTATRSISYRYMTQDLE